MNEQTAALLNNLATKLGTTSEYLWSVLIRQAFIDGCVTLAQYAVLLLAWFAAYKLLKNGKKILEYADNHDLEGPLVIGGILSAIALAICSVIAFCYLSIAFSAFFNPEYWALHEILSALPRK